MDFYTFSKIHDYKKLRKDGKNMVGIRRDKNGPKMDFIPMLFAGKEGRALYRKLWDEYDIGRKAAERRNAHYESMKNSWKDYSDVKRAGKLSRFLEPQGIFIPSDEIYNAINKYRRNLTSGKLANDDFFSSGEGEIHCLVKRFYNAEYGSRDFEEAGIKLAGFINVHTRQVMGDELDNEKREGKYVREAFTNGSEYHRVNWIKVMAWIAVHAYLTDIWIDDNTILGIFPQGSRNQNIWNKYISLMSDVPNRIKDYFYIKNGWSEFQSNCAMDVEVVSPNDDVPFDDEDIVDDIIDFASDDISSIDDIFKKKVSEVFPQEETIIDAEIIDHPISESVAEEERIKTPVQQEINFGELKKESKVKVNSPQQNDPYYNNKNINSPERINPETGMPEAVKLDIYFQNNMAWESVNPKLNIFTKYIHDLGLSVWYEAESIKDGGFPGLIRSHICESNTSNIIRDLFVDPYIVYGDTLRIVSMNNKDRDIRKESFVPITQETAIKKMITGEFTRDDHRKIYNSLPRAFSDFTRKYNLIDYIDFRSLGYNGGMPAKTYRTLVENVSNVIQSDKVPTGRYRIEVNNGDPNHFRLIAGNTDNKIQSVFNSDILRDPKAIETSKKGIWIEYDPATIKSGFKVYDPSVN